MALDYKFINTVVGNPRYGQVYAVESHPGGGEYHVYQDGTKLLVGSTGNDVLASSWHPPQQVINESTPAAAAGIPYSPPAPTPTPAPAAPAPPKVINESNPASIAGIPYDTYKAMQNTVKPLSPAAAQGIPADTYAAQQNQARNLSLDQDGSALAAQHAAAAQIQQAQTQAQNLSLDQDGAATVAHNNATAQAQQAHTQAQDRNLDMEGSALAASGGAAPPTASSGHQVLHELPGKMEVTHGMTFWQLEERHGWQHGTLEQLNPGLDPHKLAVGSFINIPQATPTAGSTPTASDASVVVGPSNSVYQAAEHDKVSQDTVKTALGGWTPGGSESQDPAKNIIEAVAHPKTNTDPLKINHDKPQSV